jgi:hypothetical protein
MTLRTDPTSSFVKEGAGNHSFTMLDGGAAVACRVTAFYLLGRASQQGLSNLSPQALFEIFRSDVEGIAAIQFDAGVFSPWVTAGNLAWV